MKKILIFSLLLAVTVATYGQKVALALNLTQGNTYYMVTSAKMAMTQNINGQTQDITTTVGGKMSFKVTSVKDTTFVMDVKYESLRMQIAAAGVNMDINTESKDTQNPVTTIMSNMTHNAFTVTMSNKGRVIAIDNFDKLLAGMFEGTSNMTDDQKTQFKTQMMQSFGPTALKGSIEACTAFFPSTKEAKNDKWTIDRTLESALSVKTRSTYTLQDITPNAYVIHADAVVTPGNTADYIETNGMPMKYLVNGTSTSDLKVDKTTGWVTEAKIIQTMKGTIDIKDNPKVPGGMSIPITMDVDQTITDK
ncbi:MAG TPA: DUF6263 family protein [Mucilaginibacter sp.]